MNAIRPLLMLFLCSSLMSFAQRGVRLAYIDMDEILENVDEYSTASLLLEKNVATWKEDIAIKKMELKGREEQLQAEKVLLTPELIEDRQNELSLFRSEIVALQTKYFGSQGSYIQQKNKLLKPIQDQVLNIVRPSDLVMLYSAKNYDISALVLQRLNAEERIKTRKKEIEERKAKIEQRLKN